MTNIILCGGNGTRLWPISRTLLPKQFVKIFDSHSLFQLTLQRNERLCQKHLVVSNIEQYFLAVDQSEESGFNDNHFVLEPLAKNTAPAIALACFSLPEDEIVLISPSDHLIKDQKSYEKVVEEARQLALKDALVTFGIKPTFAETGYGYIEAEGTDVKAFHEKPDAQTAQMYVEAQNYYWNSGIFCFKAGVFLEELQKYAPDIYNLSKKAYEQADLSHKRHLRVSYEDMLQIPEESIDYAVMEKSQRVKVVPADMAWSDLGSFDALAEEFAKDENGNSAEENLIAINSKNNFVYSKERLVALADIDDLIVVDTPDALLITKRGNSQKIKTIVKELKGRESTLHHIHVTAHRPWGTYTVLEESKNYKIKRIVVKPNKRLSLQKHFHRSEHWIVVEGKAKVSVNHQERILEKNQSTYISIGDIHRLENIGEKDLILIEVQVGSYLGEDDIVRYDDDFRRV